MFCVKQSCISCPTGRALCYIWHDYIKVPALSWNPYLKPKPWRKFPPTTRESSVVTTAWGQPAGNSSVSPGPSVYFIHPTAFSANDLAACKPHHPCFEQKSSMTLVQFWVIYSTALVKGLSTTLRNAADDTGGGGWNKCSIWWCRCMRISIGTFELSLSPLRLVIDAQAKWKTGSGSFLLLRMQTICFNDAESPCIEMLTANRQSCRRWMWMWKRPRMCNS